MNLLGILFVGVFCVLVTTIYYLLTARPAFPSGIPEGYRQLKYREWIRNGDLAVESDGTVFTVNENNLPSYRVGDDSECRYYRKESK